MMEPATHKPDTLSDSQLVRELVAEVTTLLRRQMALLQLETKTQLSRTKKTAGLLAVAGATAFAGLVLLLAAAALGLGVAWSGRFWLGALLVAGVLLLVGGVLGLWGWQSRIRHPLERSRRGIEKEARWAKGLLSHETH
jgi:fatty acid desaturase